MKQTINGKAYDIGAGQLGNGITFWNRSDEENGDFKTVAHVSNEGKVTFRSILPKEIQEMIEREGIKQQILFESKQINSLKMLRAEADPESDKYKTLQNLIHEGEKQLREKRSKAGI